MVERIRLADAAALLAVSDDTLRRWGDSGRIATAPAIAISALMVIELQTRQGERSVDLPEVFREPLDRGRQGWCLEHPSEVGQLGFDVHRSLGKWPYYEDVTADFVYIRLHGDKELYVSGYTDEALERWAARIRAWFSGFFDSS